MDEFKLVSTGNFYINYIYMYICVPTNHATE